MRPMQRVGASRQQGAAAIEFAFVVMLLLMLAVGLVGFGAMFWAQQKLAKAAGEGAQAAVHASVLGESDPVRLGQLACLGVRQEAGLLAQVHGPQAIGCTPVFASCAWRDAWGGQPLCVQVRVAYDTGGWPLLALAQQAAALFPGGAAWFPERLAAHATVQINQESSL